MHICPAHGLLEYQKQLDSDLFWAGDGRSCGIFQPFSTLAHETRLTTFLIDLANLVYKNLQGFYETLLSVRLVHHCYTLVYLT